MEYTVLGFLLGIIAIYAYIHFINRNNKKK